jgi:hypothetical protein
MSDDKNKLKPGLILRCPVKLDVRMSSSKEEIKTNLDLVEERLKKFEFAEIIKEELEEHNLLHPKDGAVITTTTFIIAPLKSAKKESELAEFAEKVKKIIEIPNSSEQKAKVKEGRVYIPILYFEEKVATVQPEYRVEALGERAKSILKKIVRKDMESIPGSGKVEEDYCGTDRIVFLGNKKSLKASVVVKIYPDVDTAKAAAKKILKSAYSIENSEVGKISSLFDPFAH